MDSIPAGQCPAHADPPSDPPQPSHFDAPHDAPPPPAPPPPPPGSNHAAFRAGRAARRQILRAFRAAGVRPLQLPT
eukprot:7920298-Lingulodinium_polyedra.AAC.1